MVSPFPPEISNHPQVFRKEAARLTSRSRKPLSPDEGMTGRGEMADSDNELPADWRSRPPSIDEIPEGVCVIQCDASWKNGVTGISTLISGSNKQYEPMEYSARSKGPIHAELTAVAKAIKRLSGLKILDKTRLVMIYTDCLYAFNFMEEIWTAKCDYIVEALSEIRESIDSLGEGVDVVVLHTRTAHNRRIDRRAKKVRESIEERKREQIMGRIETVEVAMVRSRMIDIVETQNECRAMPIVGGFPPGYLVTLDPPGCECPQWMHNWANKGEKIIRARALPCKHICALAEYLEMDIYDVFSKQIERMD